MYKRNANPVFAFLLDKCEQGTATDMIEKTTLWNKFNDYLKENKIRPISSTRYVELLKDQTEIPVMDYRPWVEHGDRPRCWQGVKLKKQAEPPENEQGELPEDQLPTPPYLTLS